MKKILTERRLCELAGIVSEVRPGGTIHGDEPAEPALPPLQSLEPLGTQEQLQARANLVRAQSRLKQFFFADPVAQDREAQAADLVSAHKAQGGRLQSNWVTASELADTYREFQKVPSDISPRDISRALLIDPQNYWLGRNRPNWKKLREDNPELAKIAIRIANATDFDFLELNSLRKSAGVPAAALANLFAQPWRQAQQDLWDEEVIKARDSLATEDPERKGAQTPEVDHLRRVHRLASSLSGRAGDDADAGQMFVDFFSERASEAYKDIVTNPPKLEAALKEFDDLIKQKQQQIRVGGAAPRGLPPLYRSSGPIKGR